MLALTAAAFSHTQGIPLLTHVRIESLR